MSFDVKGKSVSDILNMDYNDFISMNYSDMRKAVSRLVSAGNKRIRRLESRGLETGATDFVNRTGGYFSTKGKNLNQLRAEFSRAKAFFGMKSSTIKGLKEVRKGMQDRLKEFNKGKKIPESEMDRVMRSYEELKRLDPSVNNKREKYNILQSIYEEIRNSPDTPIGEVAMKMKDRVTELYEQQASKDMRKNVSMSAFFDF